MRRLALLAVLAVLISACKVKVEQGFELNADGSGQAVAIVAFDQELQDMLTSAAPGEDLVDFSDAPPGWEAEEWSEGEFRGSLAAIDFSDLAGLRSVVESDMTGDDGLLQSFTIEQVDDGFRFSALLSGESLESSLEGVEGLDLSGAADEVTSTFFDAAVTVKLPGKVVSHNADEVRSDGTLVWNVGLMDGGRAIRAESEGGGGLPIVPLAIGVVVLAAAVVGFLQWRGRPTVRSIGTLSQEEDEEPVYVAVEGDPFA